MKIFNNSRNSLKKVCSRIHLIDKCLMIIMSLLLLQSSYSLFSGPVSSEIGSIDIIIRTATASIFGYFLSSNFMRQSSGKSIEKNSSKKQNIIDSESPEAMKNKITFTSQDSETSLKAGNISVPAVENNLIEPYRDSHLQIIITAAIAIFCLLVLTVIRNMAAAEISHFTTSAQATISQFRDLISGCIGFLIGVPTTKK